MDVNISKFPIYLHWEVFEFLQLNNLHVLTQKLGWTALVYD